MILNKKELKQKIENLHISLRKKDEKIKNQSEELSRLLVQKEELQNKLNIANNTVCKQIEEIGDLTNMYEKRLSIKDKELGRRLIIIRYLEEKGIINDTN